MAVQFKRRLHETDAVILDDIRELLFLMLHVMVATPDPEGELTAVRRRLAQFIAARMEDKDGS